MTDLLSEIRLSKSIKIIEERLSSTHPDDFPVDPETQESLYHIYVGCFASLSLMHRLFKANCIPKAKIMIALNEISHMNAEISRIEKLFN